jgi:hypothetical protein
MGSLAESHPKFLLIYQNVQIVQKLLAIIFWIEATFFLFGGDCGLCQNEIHEL